MTTDAYLSRKMTVLSIIAMIAVVFIHSTAYLTMANPARWNVFVETLVTRAFSRWAVPYFFMVSGFWFGRGAFIQGDERYGILLLKKARTLLAPYLCWCAIGFLVALPLLVGNNVLTGKGIWERTIVSVPGVWTRINAFFGITSTGPESNMPLWYVRSLIVLFVLAPVWRLVLRIPLGQWLLLLLAIVGIFVRPLVIPHLCVPPSGIGWFAFGVALAQFKVENWRVSGWAWYGAMVSYAAASVMVALLAAGYVQTPMKALLFARLEDGVIPLFGVIFFWGAYDRISLLQDCALPWSLRQTFFIYCLHEIVCGYLISTARFAFGKTDVVTCACTFIVPWLVLAICACAATLTHRFLPTQYGFIVGGR